MATGTDAETDREAETGTAVRLENVRKTYRLAEPVHALDGVSLSVPRGSYTAIMGPSGSGKSTLMNLVGCLDTPTEGTVIVDGNDVTTLSGRERTRLRGTEVGFVFQTFNLMPRLTALENVALPQLFQGVSGDERRDRARELLARVGLADREDHLPSELSGGQRQRVALARALVNDPALVLADEPSGNLDTETEADVLDLFAEFHDAGTTLIVVTHERHVAERAERIVHLLDGRIERIEQLEGVGVEGGPGVDAEYESGTVPESKPRNGPTEGDDGE
ncbi:ABC transporter ATP-binding protein [Halobiforma nitratireducens]|uniref:Phosphonate-transporting ATPase n=1 Tax=Halobiforma nitratireducens JCM 10879 TaxID=1227454 RepID=M0M6A7_9EURY|nr:ABC transporter ATP-binding protein [Halobiforma nitratireducens]EMA40928.1 phosphonate-transporting ATPase [Halobiforma nitratireducens JCM 10879]